MKKEYLNSCLSKVFTRTGGAYYINDIDFLQTLIALLAYYSDGDLSDDLCADINQLHAILLNCDLYKQSKGRERIPTDFTCRLDMIGMRNGNSLPQFTFAPHVNVSFPEAKEDTLKSLSEELAALNLAALTQYVRNKAYAAGDLVLE